VRNNLDGLAKVISSAFFVNDGLVYKAGGHIVGLAGSDIEEALVMTQIQIRLCPVLRYITFSMFVRIQCSRIHIDIGVKLLDSDLESSGLKQFGKGGREDAFA
jgi:hypothetical protein